MLTEEYKNFVISAPEYLVYFMIDESSAYIHNMGLKFINKEIKPKDVVEVQKNINDVTEKHNFVMQTVIRFGLKTIYEEKDGKTYSSVEYRRWFAHWNNWKLGLPKKDWETVKIRLQQNQPLDELLPLKNWNNV